MERPSFRLHHIGINAKDREDALSIVALFCAALDLEPNTQKKGSPFAGSDVEVIPGGDRGEKGHLAFYTKDMEAGIAYLEERGVIIDHTSAKRNKDGTIYLIYLSKEIAGFAIHLFSDKK